MHPEQQAMFHPTQPTAETTDPPHAGTQPFRAPVLEAPWYHPRCRMTPADGDRQSRARCVPYLLLWCSPSWGLPRVLPHTPAPIPHPPPRFLCSSVTCFQPSDPHGRLPDLSPILVMELVHESVLSLEERGETQTHVCHQRS